MDGYEGITCIDHRFDNFILDSKHSDKNTIISKKVKSTLFCSNNDSYSNSINCEVTSVGDVVFRPHQRHESETDHRQVLPWFPRKYQQWNEQQLCQMARTKWYGFDRRTTTNKYTVLVSWSLQLPFLGWKIHMFKDFFQFERLCQNSGNIHGIEFANRSGTR